VAQAKAKPQATAPDRSIGTATGDGQKYAHVKSGAVSAWLKGAKALAARVPYYQDKDGQANLYHLVGSALKCGYQEITDDNLAAVLRDLEQHATEQMTEVPR